MSGVLERRRRLRRRRGSKETNAGHREVTTPIIAESLRLIRYRISASAVRDGHRPQATSDPHASDSRFDQHPIGVGSGWAHPDLHSSRARCTFAASSLTACAGACRQPDEANRVWRGRTSSLPQRRFGVRDPRDSRRRAHDRAAHPALHLAGLCHGAIRAAAGPPWSSATGPARQVASPSPRDRSPES